MAEMTDEERERRYKRFYGEEVSPLRAILESPRGVKLWGARFEGYGLGILHQAREDRLRKEKEEASRRKDKDTPDTIQGEEEHGNSTPPETIQGEEEKGNSSRPEQGPEAEEQGNSPRQEQGPEAEEQGNSPRQEKGPDVEPGREKKVRMQFIHIKRSDMDKDSTQASRKRGYDSREETSHVQPEREKVVRRHKRSEMDKDSTQASRKPGYDSREETSHVQPEREKVVRRHQGDEKVQRQQGIHIKRSEMDKDSTQASRKRGYDSREETSHVEPEREKIRLDEEQGNSQPPSERNPPSDSLLPPYYQDPDPEAPQYFDDMAKFYLEAARRLPLAQMPKLAGFLSLGGVLLGVNDPVTNIIINAIYLMGNFRHSDVLPHGADPVRHAADKASYVAVARRSRAALVVFMVSYFRHLTEAQAKRYLHAAGQDLALAIGLVEWHRKWSFRTPSEVLDELSPDCTRTKTALRYAAQAAMLPQDPNDLVRLLTSRFPRHLFDLVLDDLRRGEKLSVGRVKDILNLLRHPWSPSPPLPAPTPGHSRDDKGNLAIITNFGQGLFSTTSITVATYNSNKNGGKDVASVTTFCDDQDGDDLVGTAYLSTDLDRKARFRSFLSTTAAHHLEPDTNSIRMCLLDTIHGFYIEALAILPSDHHPRLLHAVLAAGHCYGIMDKPVHNIIINSIWYRLCYPPPKDETVQIDPLSLTRMASCSLNGLMVLTHNKQGAILSERNIMLNLLGRMDCLAYPESGNADHHLLVAVLEAAKHPQPLRLVELIEGLLPYKNRLHEVMNLKLALSDSDLYVIRDIIAGVTKILPSYPDPGQLTLMDPGHGVQAHVRTKLEELLLNYCCKYHWGPPYKLSIIFGVASTVCSSYIKGTTCYHANFLASTGDVPASGCMLFFAEFWNQEDDDFEESKMPPACWPVPHEDIRYHRRCFICEGAAIRVVHPFDVNYFMGQRFCTDSLCAVAEHEAALGGTEVKISSRL